MDKWSNKRVLRRKYPVNVSEINETANDRRIKYYFARPIIYSKELNFKYEIVIL